MGGRTGLSDTVLEASDFQNKPHELTTAIHKDLPGWHTGDPPNCTSSSTQSPPPFPGCLPVHWSHRPTYLGIPRFYFGPNSFVEVLPSETMQIVLTPADLANSCGRKLAGDREELEEAGNKQVRARGTDLHSWPPWREGDGQSQEW